MANDATGKPIRIGGPYAWYVLVVLVIVYMQNFIDRSIISTLAPYLKEDQSLGRDPTPKLVHQQLIHQKYLFRQK